MPAAPLRTIYDVIILGAGHNALVAAAYLGRAGLSVLILEKNDYIGGATTSQKAFPAYDAYLSRYSYLVSLFPPKIVSDLGLNIELRRRDIAAYTPYTRGDSYRGLLLSNVDEHRSRRSLRELTGSDTEFRQQQQFYNLVRLFAEKTWDTLLLPLLSKDEIQRSFTDEREREAWRGLVEEPLGLLVERYLSNDLLRGVVFTDAKVGVLTHPHDPSLLQNRCFLYHVIGNRTGEWKVPVGGMGRVAEELERAARGGGAEIITRAGISAIDLAGKKQTVEFTVDGKSCSADCRFLLVNFGRNVLESYIDNSFKPAAEDEGSVFKINMVLRRLPKLKANDCSAAEAFCGTFHSDEGYEQMERSYNEAAAGQLPLKPPCEVYCHTLTDDSILSPQLRADGFHTLTLFGLDAPYSIFAADNAITRKKMEQRYLASLNQWLAEPLEDCLARDAEGRVCVESKTPVDIEQSLGMYHGNIFHTAPSFPFAVEDGQAGTWGVETEWESVFFCGSSALRGGAVSGIPGHNAAMKVLAAR